MNLQVWLGPHIDVPHLVLVFGTVPNVFHFSDVVPRRDPMVDVDYLNKLLRAREREVARPPRRRPVPLVGQPRHLHAGLQLADRQLLHGDLLRRRSRRALREAVRDRVDTWLQWVRDAEPVPVEERAALRERDHMVRKYGYTMDPMNELSKKFLGEQRVNELVATRAGLDQIAAA